MIRTAVAWFRFVVLDALRVSIRFHWRSPIARARHLAERWYVCSVCGARFNQDLHTPNAVGATCHCPPCYTADPDRSRAAGVAL